MKAAVYYETGGPGVFKYEDVPDPPLHPKGVLIDVQGVSIEGDRALADRFIDLFHLPPKVG